MKKIVLLIVCAFVSTFVFSQKVSEVITDKYKLYIQSENEFSQIKNGLKIEIIPLHPGLIHDYPELFSWDLEKMPSEWQFNLSTYYMKLFDGKYYEYPLRAGDKFIIAFKIKISNNTDHILRMSDARIYLRVEGEDPIKPVTKFGNATLVDVTPPNTSSLKMRDLLPQSVIDKDYESLIYAVTKIWYDWDDTRKKGLISFRYPVGFPSQIMVQNKKAFRLINDVDVEILPEDSYSGILLFPHTINEDNISIKLYDFTTKTDAAGNAAEKSNFDFKFILSNGSNYFDRNLKKWIVGTPPQKVEYYDKKQKVWIYGNPVKK